MKDTDKHIPDTTEPVTDGTSASPDASQAGGVVVAASSGKKPVNKKKIVKIVLASVCLAIVAFLLFMAIWLLIDKTVNKSPVPMFMGVATLTVETGSMSGTIEEGDLIVIKKTNDYKIGDIITFLPEGDKIPTTHRIIGIEDGKYITRGDANNTADTRPIAYDRIIGEYQFSIRYVGLFFRWLGQEGGWIYLAGIVVVIIIGVLLLKMYPADKPKDASEKKTESADTDNAKSADGDNGARPAPESANAETEAATPDTANVTADATDAAENKKED